LVKIKHLHKHRMCKVEVRAPLSIHNVAIGRVVDKTNGSESVVERVEPSTRGTDWAQAMVLDVDALGWSEVGGGADSCSTALDIRRESRVSRVVDELGEDTATIHLWSNIKASKLQEGRTQINMAAE
jgi:hypothetical protein